MLQRYWRSPHVSRGIHNALLWGMSLETCWASPRSHWLTSSNEHWIQGKYRHSCCMLSLCRRHHERPCPENEMNKNQPPEPLMIDKTNQPALDNHDWDGFVSHLTRGISPLLIVEIPTHKPTKQESFPLWVVAVERTLGPWHGESTVCKTPRQELTICKRAIMVDQL